MWEAFAYALWFTLLLVFEMLGVLLAVASVLLELLVRLLRWTWRALAQLARDVRAWRRAAPELAVREYPQAKRARPLPTGQLPPRELKH